LAVADKASRIVTVLTGLSRIETRKAAQGGLFSRERLGVNVGLFCHRFLSD